jgi:HEPN domain-containing protein
MELSQILENIKQKYSDANLLADNGRYSNASYLAGYCVELSLKYAIARHLRWSRFNSEGKFKFLKVHDLELLLALSGSEASLAHLPEWGTVSMWDESDRYSDPSSTSRDEALAMITSTKYIVEQLCAISL